MLRLCQQVLDRLLKIRFTREQSFALQRDDLRGKERAVRRVVKTIQEVKVMLDRIARPPLDPAELAEMLPHGTIPHHFLCPITQDIMQDPVKTVDGMTYDRPAIERWLSLNSTSPLTGLPLASKALQTNASVREQIGQFLEQHAHLKQPEDAGT